MSELSRALTRADNAIADLLCAMVIETPKLLAVAAVVAVFGLICGLWSGAI